jgi:hypothetical protein
MPNLVRSPLLLLLSLVLFLTACAGGGRSRGDDDDGDDDDSAADDDDATDDDDAADDDDDAADDDDASTSCSAPDISSAPSPALGQSFFSWEGLTPKGSRTDVCTMAGTPFLFVMSAGWCGPCNDLASGIAGGSHGYGPGLDSVVAAVNDGQLGLVEAMVDPWNDYGPATATFLQQWEADYPNPAVLLLGDDSGDAQGSGEVLWSFFGGVSGGSVPFAVLVDGNYNYQALGTEASIAMAADLYGL